MQHLQLQRVLKPLNWSLIRRYMCSMVKFHNHPKYQYNLSLDIDISCNCCWWGWFQLRLLCSHCTAETQREENPCTGLHTGRSHSRCFQCSFARNTDSQPQGWKNTEKLGGRGRAVQGETALWMCCWECWAPHEWAFCMEISVGFQGRKRARGGEEGREGGWVSSWCLLCQAKIPSEKRSDDVSSGAWNQRENNQMSDASCQTFLRTVINTDFRSRGPTHSCQNKKNNKKHKNCSMCTRSIFFSINDQMSKQVSFSVN